MEKVILIKYGELTTKKDNRKLFVNALYNNLRNKFNENNLNVNILRDLSRMYFEYNEDDEKEIMNVVDHTFGIHAYDIAYKVETEEQKIYDLVLELVKKQSFKTFKVYTKRSDKSFIYNSMEFNRKIGGLILKNIDNISVDVNNPELWVNIEIRRDYTYVYFNEYMGLGGYPSGTLGKGLLMLSGGIDSPVAGYLALKRGIKLNCVYFEAIPHTSIEARNKVIELSKKLLPYTNSINLFVIPFTDIQESIYKNIDPTYCITIMRRMMYRIMDRLTKKLNAKVIVNGESVGQVASQTLTSMYVINNVTNVPVIRPCACLDKLEIIDISEKIDTYNISILPYEDCCTVFVPKHPVINPELNKCIEFEKSFDYETKINEAIENMLKIEITNKNEYEDLL